MEIYKPKLTPQQRDDMVARYIAGEPLLAVASKFGVSYQNLTGHLRRRGIPLRPRPSTSRPKLTPKQRASMFDSYLAGEPAHLVAPRFGIPVESLKRQLLCRGLPYREMARRVHDESVFESITTEQQAWLLGWIATDGNIYGNQLVIRLKAGDRDALEKMKLVLKTDAPVTSHVRPNDGYSYVGLRVISQKIVSDLARLGVHPRKSFTVRPWDGPPHLLAAYWRGAFEGDGTIRSTIVIRHTNPYRNWSMLFCGNIHMVQGFSGFIGRQVKTKATLHPQSSIYRIKYDGCRLARTVAHVLYDGATVWLDRKKLLADELMVQQEQRKYKLTHEQRNQMVTSFSSGDSLASIAKRFGCSVQNVWALLRRRRATTAT